MEKILTPAEVADVMRLNRRTVYKLLESGELRGRKVGRVWRIPQSAIGEYMDGDQAGGGDFPAFPYGKLLTDRQGQTMIVFWDIMTGKVDYRFPDSDPKELP